MCARSLDDAQEIISMLAIYTCFFKAAVVRRAVAVMRGLSGIHHKWWTRARAIAPGSTNEWPWYCRGPSDSFTTQVFLIGALYRKLRMVEWLIIRSSKQMIFSLAEWDRELVHICCLSDSVQVHSMHFHRRICGLKVGFGRTDAEARNMKQLNLRTHCSTNGPNELCYLKVSTTLMVLLACNSVESYELPRLSM